MGTFSLNFLGLGVGRATTTAAPPTRRRTRRRARRQRERVLQTGAATVAGRKRPTARANATHRRRRNGDRGLRPRPRHPILLRRRPRLAPLAALRARPTLRRRARLPALRLARILPVRPRARRRPTRRVAKTPRTRKLSAERKIPVPPRPSTARRTRKMLTLGRKVALLRTRGP